MPKEPRTKRRVSVRTLSVDTRRLVAVGKAGVQPDVLEGLDRDATHAWRHYNVGRLLLFAFHAFEARLLEGYARAGFGDVKQVHLNVLRYIDSRGGTRIVDLASRAGVTKGAMGQLVEDCLQLGLVEVLPDQRDRRAKIVRFAERGRAFMTVTKRTIRLIETEFARYLGERRFREMREALVELRQSIAEGESGDSRSA